MVRRALPQDIPGMLELRERVLDAPWRREILTEPSAEDLDENNIVVVAVRKNGKVVGTGRFDHIGDGIYNGRRVATDPELQGLGIGRKVMNLLEQTATELGGRQVTLDARAVDP